MTDLGSVGLALIDAPVLRNMERTQLRKGLRRIFVEDDYFSGEEKYHVSTETTYRVTIHNSKNLPLSLDVPPSCLGSK